MFQLLFSAVSILLLAASSFAHAQTDPTRVPALFSKGYFPGGFDSNDHVQIVGEGMFRNTCYRHAETTVAINEETRRIHVGPVAYEYHGFCLQVILPFVREIDIGILKPGKWEVVQGPSADRMGEIVVRHALRNDPDDFLYAPISQAFFQQKGKGGQVILAGEFTNDCLSIEHVRTTIEPEVIVLQPVVKIDPRSKCKSGKFPFTKLVPINEVPKGRYLLHVRSMNGNAVNSIVQVN